MTTFDLSAASAASATSRSAPTRTGWLQWYMIAVLVTTICTFTYLAAVRSAITHGGSASLEAAATLLWLGGLTAPLVVALKGVVAAVTAWAVLALLGEATSYTTCIVAAWKAEVALSLWGGVQGIISFVKGPESAGSLAFPMGLDAFWSPATPALAVLSHTVNIFFVASLVVFWWALRRVEQHRPSRAAAGVAVGATAAVSLGVSLIRFF